MLDREEKILRRAEKRLGKEEKCSAEKKSAQQRRNMLSRKEEKQLSRTAMNISEEHCDCEPLYQSSYCYSSYPAPLAETDGPSIDGSLW